jgi:hypothetical protein
LIVAAVLLAGAAALVWRATRPIDTTPPKAVLAKVEPNKPLFAEHEQQVTFVLRDDQGGIPTFFVFEDPDQKLTALGINTLRGTPNERGVEIRFEAVRFRRDEMSGGSKLTRSSVTAWSTVCRGSRVSKYLTSSSCRGGPKTMRQSARAPRRFANRSTSRESGIAGTYRSIKAPRSCVNTQYGTSSLTPAPRSASACVKAASHRSANGSVPWLPYLRATFLRTAWPL